MTVSPLKTDWTRATPCLGSTMGGVAVGGFIIGYVDFVLFIVYMISLKKRIISQEGFWNATMGTNGVTEEVVLEIFLEKAVK
jgi:hypothetical protein